MVTVQTIPLFIAIMGEVKNPDETRKHGDNRYVHQTLFLS